MKAFEIKICGITREEDATSAIHSGATALGFVFVPGRRLAEPEFAHQISRNFPNALRVGVIQNLSAEETVALVDRAALNAIQFHGSESFEFVQQVKSKLFSRAPYTSKSYQDSKNSAESKFRFIRALDVDESLTSPTISKWSEICDTLLFDSPRAKHSNPQATGAAPPKSAVPRNPLDVALLIHRLNELSHPLNFWIAGGLNAETVANPIRLLNERGIVCAGVDVSSGVEISPGIKDPNLIRNFIENTKGASRASK